ncbi:unnamed protein product [Camellia sinensis]
MFFPLTKNPQISNPLSFEPKIPISLSLSIDCEQGGQRCQATAARVDLDRNPIKPITMCMISAGGFIGLHLCEKLASKTPHKMLAVDVYNDKIKHLLEPASLLWADRIQFHRINIKNDSRLEGLISRWQNLLNITLGLA